MYSNERLFRSFIGIAALTTAAIGSQGCVTSRDARNGVFNENQYLRKDFLVRGADAATDPGWYMKATVVQTSTPNPFANLDLFTGAENSGAIVRFAITPDKMQLVDIRELSNSDDIKAQNTRTPSIVNAWPITNVDLKYRVNLDGETTNFYEENQEANWQDRQWVKVNFDKNDLSDIAGLGPFQAAFLKKCTDGDFSTTLVPNSFLVDDKNGYMQWTVAVTAAPNLTDAQCMQAFGALGLEFQRMGRSTVTLNVMYSLARANKVDPNSYTPLVVDEKDSIRHKYGPIELTNYSRDLDTGLMAARQLVIRYNPSKPIVWYFAAGYPDKKKEMWTRAGGIVDQTNAVLQKAGAAARLSVLNYNDGSALGDAKGPARDYGDVRYNFIRWESDLDTGSPFLAVTQFQPDLRTGEAVSASINVAAYPLKDFVGQRTRAYMEKVLGADPFSEPPPDPANPGKTLPATCTEGQTVALLNSSAQSNIYGHSTLYQKMAQYLPAAPNGSPTPGPADFIYSHPGTDGAQFYKAYLALLPFITYADPLANQFVTPSDLSSEPAGMAALFGTLAGETKFQQAMSDLDHGKGLAALEIAHGPSAMKDAYDAVDNVRQLWQAHRDYVAAWQLPHSTMRGDSPDVVSLTSLVNRSARRCVATGGTPHWQTRDEWMTELVDSYEEQTVWHEFGHVMGLDHNFMASVDKANWPTYKAADGSTHYGLLSSSVMDYNVSYDRTFWNNGGDASALKPGWGSYDQAAIAWIYANNLSKDSVGPKKSGAAAALGISGQVSATEPWNDPIGFSGKDETQFLYCNASHIRYTPLCRMFDVGSTPSEITAADIEQYEYNYQWRNFRNYYKVWDASGYAGSVANILGDSRRFLAMWAWDWSNAELKDKLIRVGIVPPPGAPNSGLFYTQLSNHFSGDVGAAEELIAAFHEGIIQQATGQRPFTTSYDPFFGDVTQQGIAVDKELAFINWLGLWPFDNYDPTQAHGYLFSSMVIGPGNTHPSQAWSAAASMLGEKGPWDAYPSFFPSAVALFAHDTQTPTFTGLGYAQMREWIGGHVFKRLPDAISYFQNVAVANPLATNGCADLATCKYNPMLTRVNSADVGHSDPATGAFIGPDGRRWTWVYIADRNVWFFVDQDRNPSAYGQVLTYNNDVFTLHDDGNAGPIYAYQARIKYMIDAYDAFNGSTTE